MTISLDGTIQGTCLEKNCQVPAAGNYHCGRCHKERPVAAFPNPGGINPDSPGDCQPCLDQLAMAKAAKEAAEAETLAEAEEAEAARQAAPKTTRAERAAARAAKKNQQ
jgi:hypothetical protein